jgi:hypothetical protein
MDHFELPANIQYTLAETTIFSHELVEVCTDPDGNGFQVTPLNPNNWHEIG